MNPTLKQARPILGMGRDAEDYSVCQHCGRAGAVLDLDLYNQSRTRHGEFTKDGGKFLRDESAFSDFWMIQELCFVYAELLAARLHELRRVSNVLDQHPSGELFGAWRDAATAFEAAESRLRELLAAWREAQRATEKSFGPVAVTDASGRVCRG